MLHNEHFRRADELYEIRHDDKGNAIHVYIKDGEAIIFPTLLDFFSYMMEGEDVERWYLSDEDDLGDIYISKDYDYYTLKSKFKK